MKRLLLLVSSVGCVALANAQSVGPSIMNTAGGSKTIAGNTYEWSIGEMITSTHVGGSLVVTQGILQPLNATTGVTTIPSKMANLKVYPNPVTNGWLYLQPNFETGGKVTCSITDATGRLVILQSEELQNGTELQSIPMNALAIGQYTLTVTWKDKQGEAISNFKIQKIQ